ncbi:MAG: NAD-dependent epimerase/dehydratase family protein [Burkholderiaceae bacterium]
MDHLGHALTQPSAPLLVTGAGGYLGGRILAQLQQRGLPVLGIGRTPDRAGACGLVCDLLDPLAVSQLMAQHTASPVLHCAAVVPKEAGGYADAQAAEQSLQMLRNVLAAQPAQIILTSSMTVYPDGTRLACEADARAEAGGYAAAKLAAERLLLARQGRCDVVLRLPGLFGGPRRSGLLYNAALAYARGERPVLAQPLPQWAALHVDDAAELCLRAALSPPAGPCVLNAGYPDAMSIPDALRQLAALLGQEPGELPAALPFAFDLTALHAALGPVAGAWADRLTELAASARKLAHA